MKITRHLVIAGWGISIILTGCLRVEPEAPKLIAPVDGETFDKTPPTLIWSASNPEAKYLVKLNMTVGVKDTCLTAIVTDTTYTPAIEGIEYATIKWCIGVEVDTGTLWSETWTFYMDARENVPNLVSPDIGAVFDSLPPTFIWSKEDVSEYYLTVFKDSLWSKDTLVWDTLADTTFTMSASVFALADSGTYKWTVAVRDTASGELLYPSARSFRIEFGDTPLPPIDLDTTYFPFGLGYEWCYLRHSWQYVSDPFWDSWDKFDTVMVSVTDSFWSGDTLSFSFTGSIYGMSEPTDIIRNMVFIFGESIRLIPDPETKETDLPYGWGEFAVSYKTDTLYVSVSGSDPYGEGVETWRSTRLTGIGAIRQGRSYSGSSCGVDWDDGYSDRLLWFYNGKDTVYKAKDWGVIIDVNLDTTYFPLGIAYKWTYQRHSWGSTQSGDSTITWNDYDTFTVSVADSFWESNVMHVSFSDTGKFFHDLSNPAKVMDGKVLVQMWDGVTPWVNPYLPETKWGGIIQYSKDTLKISFGGTPAGEDPYYSYYKEWTYRLRNIGPILQGTSYSNWDFGEESYTSDSLILFTTPEGQIWP